MNEEEKFSDVIMEIQAGYLISGCDGCPFYGIEEYGIKQRCDSVPINCIWWCMNRYFRQVEQEEEQVVDEGDK